MNKALIIPKQAIPQSLETLDTSLVDQFQHELNTVFSSNWFKQLSSTEQDAFLFAGVATESGEVIDCYKKDYLVKGNMDTEHLMEEIGDTMWHLSTICTRHGCTLADAMKMCMKKFRHRYPERYCEEV